MNSIPVHQWTKDQVLTFCVERKGNNKSEAEARSWWNDRYVKLVTLGQLSILNEAIEEIRKADNTIGNEGAFLNARSNPHPHVTSDPRPGVTPPEMVNPMPGLGYPSPMALDIYAKYFEMLPGEKTTINAGMEKPGFDYCEISEMIIKVIRAHSGKGYTSHEIQNLRAKWYWRIRNTAENPQRLKGISGVMNILYNVKHGKLLLSSITSPNALFMAETEGL